MTNPRKDWEIRIFKGFSINTAHGQSQLSQEKVRDFTQIYPLTQDKSKWVWHFDTLTLLTPCSLNLVSYQEIECEEKKDGGEDEDEVWCEGLALWRSLHYFFLFYHLHLSYLNKTCNTWAIFLSDAKIHRFLKCKKRLTCQSFGNRKWVWQLWQL